MNGGRCEGCSTQLQPCCRCGRVPTNLAFVKKVLNTPKRSTKCPCKYPKCLTLRTDGESIDCLCSLNEDFATSVDRRLQTWERELELRNNLAERLMQRTGKSYCELLFNRAVTVDGRDKLMMQRLLAHAESRNPRTRHKKAVIKERFNYGCCLMELSSKIPATKEYFEVTGLPAGVKCELIGENCCVQRSRWISSQGVLENIASKGKDIKRVLPFFPDIEYLQIIGKKMTIQVETVDFQEDKGACCSPCGVESNESTNNEACSNEKCPTLVSFANLDEVIDDDDCTIETCRAYAKSKDPINLVDFDEFCSNDTCPAYVSPQKLGVEETVNDFCTNDTCQAYMAQETCEVTENADEFCTNDTCSAYVAQTDTQDEQNYDANYEEVGVGQSAVDFCSSDTSDSALANKNEFESFDEICNKNACAAHAKNGTTCKKICPAMSNKQTQGKYIKLHKKAKKRKSVEAEASPSCSDLESDYYSELICNRAKCHNIFYRPCTN